MGGRCLDHSQGLPEPGEDLLAADPADLRSNSFRIEWPPRSGRWQQQPEFDRFAWLGLPEMRRLIVRAQAMLPDELEAALAHSTEP